MIRFKNVQTVAGERCDFSFEGEDEIIDGSSLTVLPALIDPHVHFRTPGEERKENWESGARAALHGGVTHVFDMPNNIPSCATLDEMKKKKRVIEAQLKNVGIPLRYNLYIGAHQDHLHEILEAAEECVGVKIFMGCSTGGLLLSNKESLEEAFRLAAERNLVVAVHAEDEALLNEGKKKYPNPPDVSFHSRIRSKSAACKATLTALELAAKYNVTLYLLHMSTKNELEIIRQAKRLGVKVFAEVTPHHLFFTVDDYKSLGTLVQMNPPLRDQEDQEALWAGVKDGSIDTIGSDHAPHTLAEKAQPYGNTPSGIPGVELILPLMLDAVANGKLTLQRLIELTRTNIEKIFHLPPNDDLVFVDLNLEMCIDNRHVKSKCGWTPYAGRILKGTPLYTILRGGVYALTQQKFAEKEQVRAARTKNVGEKVVT